MSGKNNAISLRLLAQNMLLSGWALLFYQKKVRGYVRLKPGGKLPLEPVRILFTAFSKWGRRSASLPIPSASLKSVPVNKLRRV